MLLYGFYLTLLTIKYLRNCLFEIFMMKKYLGTIYWNTFFCLVYFLMTSFIHPYHVGSVEYNYNSKSKTFEITGKFFIDDLENALNKHQSKNLHFQNKKEEKQMAEALKKYCAENLSLKVNGKVVPVQFVGYEEDKESVEFFLESAQSSQPKEVETTVKFIYNLFDDQMNILHIVVNGKRKSDRLSFPKTYLKQSF